MPECSSFGFRAEPETRSGVEALAQAVLQGEAILPESLIQGQQFEDLRDVPGEDIVEDTPVEVSRWTAALLFYL